MDIEQKWHRAPGAGVGFLQGSRRCMCAYERLLGAAITGSSRIKIHQWLHSHCTEASCNKVKTVSMTCRD